ncbi:response regulator [Pontiella sulfatireligans]|uniref:Transcriptional regulatory protein LiaR n=1 Tax=Pontiella sulfatireligans TaxID=2750658 RepID=A0A6C2UEL4_9BACT|nr:response regulator transcription factor [Pontiella sulfatireligans]VGO18313.1 Transcriptional regulatory protein LiaR [Pontiella sulfatireligans]
MKRKIRVMLLEDNPEYREVISLALKDEPDIELTSQFGTSEIALRSLQDMSTRKEPDLILLDLRLPGMDGLDSLPYFRTALPDVKIIILTQSDDEADVLRAISRGAAGYLLKSSTLNQITEGIHTVMDGGAPLDAGVARFILDTLQSNMPKEEVENMLTPRELEILTLLGEGLLKKEIADKLEISYSTVDTHVAHIYEKLEVRNAPSAVNKAHRLGLFP